MPFTLSHIAATLPLASGTRTGVPGEPSRRGPLVASALAFGSMAPDAVLFVDLRLGPLSYERGDTHAVVPGVFLIAPVLTALAVAVWHLLLLRPLLALVPDAIRARIEAPLLPHVPADLRTGRLSPRELVGIAGWFLVSSWIGALTHLCWDAWTHYGDPGVANVAPWLRDEGLFGRPWFVLLQHTSTVVGLAAITWWSTRRFTALPAHPVDHRTRIGVPARLAVLAALSLAGLAAAIHRMRPYSGQPFEVVGFYFATGFGRGLAVALLTYGALWAIWRNRGMVTRAG